jgi:hypothetical protein
VAMPPILLLLCGPVLLKLLHSKDFRQPFFLSATGHSPVCCHRGRAAHARVPICTSTLRDYHSWQRAEPNLLDNSIGDRKKEFRKRRACSSWSHQLQMMSRFSSRCLVTVTMRVCDLRPTYQPLAGHPTYFELALVLCEFDFEPFSSIIGAASCAR